MQKGLYEELSKNYENNQVKFAELRELSKYPNSKILASVAEDNNHRKTLFNFVHNMDSANISKNIDRLNIITY